MDRVSLFIYITASAAGIGAIVRALALKHGLENRGVKFFLYALGAFVLMSLLNFAVTYIFTMGFIEDSLFPENLLTFPYALYSFAGIIYYTFFIASVFELTNKPLPTRVIIIFSGVQFLALVLSVFVILFPGSMESVGRVISIRILDLYSRIILSAVFIVAIIKTGSQTDKSSRRAMRIFLSLFLVIEAGNFLHHDLFPDWYRGEVRAVTNAISFAVPMLVILVGYRPFIILYFRDREKKDPGQERLLRLLKEKNISKRESLIIEGICLGRSNKEIAADLSISLASVKFHSHKIYRKLEIGNRVELCNLIKAV